MPSGVQGLIAARLDTLSPDRKHLLQDAAVIGKVFWSGAVAKMGERDPKEVSEALHELSRKELIRPARASSMAVLAARATKWVPDGFPNPSRSRGSMASYASGRSGVVAA